LSKLNNFIFEFGVVSGLKGLKYVSFEPFTRNSIKVILSLSELQDEELKHLYINLKMLVNTKTLKKEVIFHARFFARLTF
jgi:hypothetical protein